MKLRLRTSAGSSQPLHRHDRFGPSGAAHRRRLDLVRENREHVELEMRDDVRPRHRCRGDPRQHDAPRHIGAGLVDELTAHAEDPGVCIDCDFHVPVLIALLVRGQKILAPVLDPFHGPSEPHRGGSDVHVLGIERTFGPEAAADVRRLHAHLVVADLEHFEHAALDAVRALRRHMHRQRIGERFVGGDCAAALDEKRAAAMLIDLLAEDVLRSGENAIGVADFHWKARGDVGVASCMCQRRIGFDGGATIIHGGQRLVFDFHELRCVLGNIAALRDDARDRLACIARLIFDERIRHVRLLDRGVRDEQRQSAAPNTFGQV
jgi:hypothetical protein